MADVCVSEAKEYTANEFGSLSAIYMYGIPESRTKQACLHASKVKTYQIR